MQCDPRIETSPLCFEMAALRVFLLNWIRIIHKQMFLKLLCEWGVQGECRNRAFEYTAV